MWRIPSICDPIEEKSNKNNEMMKLRLTGQ